MYPFVNMCGGIKLSIISLQSLKGKLISVRILLATLYAALLHSGSHIYFHRQELRSHYISLAFSLTRSIKHWHHQTFCLSGCKTATATLDFSLCTVIERLCKIYYSLTSLKATLLYQHA